MKYKSGSCRDLIPCSLKMSYTLGPVGNHYTTCPFAYFHIPCGSSIVLAHLQPHPPSYRGRLCDSTGNKTLTAKRQGGVIEEGPRDPIERQGPVGGGDPDLDILNDPDLEILNPPPAQQRSPDSLPDVEDREHQAFDALGDPVNGIPPDEEGIPASPITLEVQIEQIQADNALAEQLQADAQIVADNALPRQLQAHHSITVLRLWPENGQIPESANTPEARGLREILLPDPSDPAAHIQLLPESSRRNRRMNSQRRSLSPSTKPGHRQQLLRRLLRTIGRSVQLPAPLEQPIARNESFQYERKPKENPTRTRTTDQHRPGLRTEFQL